MIKKNLQKLFNFATNFLLFVVFITVIVTSFLITLNLNPRSQINNNEIAVLGTNNSELKKNLNRDKQLSIKELIIYSMGITDISVVNYNFTSNLTETSQGVNLEVKLRDLKNKHFTGELLNLTNKGVSKKNIIINSKIPEQILKDLYLSLIINDREYLIYDDYGNKINQNLILTIPSKTSAKLTLKVMSYKPISYLLAFEFNFVITD